MSATNLLFVAIGAVALLIGTGMLVAAIRGKAGETPRHTVMLIVGMMVAAFGLLMAAFAISMATAPARESAQ